MVMTRNYSAIIQRKLPSKKKDLGNFQIHCTIRNITFERALYDLGASINLMSLYVMKKLQIQEMKSTRIALQMADKSIKNAYGVVKNVLIKVEKVSLPVGFVILDMEEDDNAFIILARPFLASERALKDVKKDELMLRAHDEHLIFHVFKTMHYSSEEENCMKIE
ncbi:uncharacterized protein LOC130975392 [Arachis stenosperma]|uniref:uncharacterized protein LOC130975392 n=1 Tax=Arachis stenosperma TaxID=217475 RepID=UPI0025AC1FD6|nr:uncharacterized protein LOC130975392 [Arachis stenosperma]